MLSDETRGRLLKILEWRFDETSTVLCTQHVQKDWHHRLGSGAHADATMGCIVHNAI